jgi:hypothetical protein
MTPLQILLFISFSSLLFAETCLKDKELLTSERWKEISVVNVLARAPELKDNMQPVQMARLIN